MSKHTWIITDSAGLQVMEVDADKLVVDEGAYIFFNEDRKDQPLVIPVGGLIAIPDDDEPLVPSVTWVKISR